VSPRAQLVYDVPQKAMLTLGQVDPPTTDYEPFVLCKPFLGSTP